MAEKTDRELIEEVARIARILEEFAKRLFAWILGMIFLLLMFEMIPLLLGDVTYHLEYDNAIRLILLLVWTICIFFIVKWGEEN